MNLKQVTKQFNELKETFIGTANQDNTFRLMIQEVGGEKIVTSQNGLTHTYTIEKRGEEYDVKAVVNSTNAQ